MNMMEGKDEEKMDDNRDGNVGGDDGCDGLRRQKRRERGQWRRTLSAYPGG